MRAVGTTGLAILIIGLVAQSGPWATAHDESPFTPLRGRVERPGSGYVITFPDGWVAQELTEEVYWALYGEAPDEDQRPDLYAQRQEDWPASDCGLYDITEYALAPPAFTKVEDGARDWAGEGEVVRSFDFGAGRVGRVSGVDEEGWSHEVYFFHHADRWMVLDCWAPEPDEDFWRIAHSFEFLPARAAAPSPYGARDSGSSS